MWEVLSPIMLGMLTYLLVMQICECISVCFMDENESEDEQEK